MKAVLHGRVAEFDLVFGSDVSETEITAAYWADTHESLTDREIDLIVSQNAERIFEAHAEWCASYGEWLADLASGR